jgi:hypothetical protein
MTAIKINGCTVIITPVCFCGTVTYTAVVTVKRVSFRATGRSRTQAVSALRQEVRSRPVVIKWGSA